MAAEGEGDEFRTFEAELKAGWTALKAEVDGRWGAGTSGWDSQKQLRRLDRDLDRDPLKSASESNECMSESNP